MSKLSFEEAVAKLGEFQSRGWRLGLDRMQEFLRRLGLEDKLGGPGGPQFIHVAGTNGKGSVCGYLQSMLHEQGWRVGATFSPYVYDVRERVQLGRDLISKEDFARLTERLLEVGETLEDTEFGGPTEFEMKTALGFLYWAEKGADWVALEVGLGGRLDATNVVDPACSVIVSIGMDHTDILGDTLALIAREKAGIIKPGRPVVVGELPQEALEVVLEVADANGSRAIVCGRDFEPWVAGVEPGLLGSRQQHNLAVALAAMSAAGSVKDEGKIEAGAARAQLPGRYERISAFGRRFILDGAHNPEAAGALVESMRADGTVGSVALITGRLEGHDSRAFYEALSPVVARTFVAKIDFHRAREPREVIEEAGTALGPASAHESAGEALQACLDSTNEGDTVLVTGSFYLVGEIGRALGRG